MFGKTPLEKAFYRDMLAHGIPVTEKTCMSELYDILIDAASELDFYDVLMEENNLVISNREGVHCVTIKKETVDEEIKLIFYTPAYEAAFENADVVGNILLLVITLCTTKKWLNIQQESSAATEQSYEFDSDFV